MKSPRGFGRSYFSLSAILAYSAQGKLQSQMTSVYSLMYSKTGLDNDEVCECDPPSDVFGFVFISNLKPCSCNTYFRIKTRIILLINTFIPRCPFYCTYFAYRRTGVHPPCQ